MSPTLVNHLEAIETHSGTPAEIAGNPAEIAATAIANAQDSAKQTWTPTEQRLDPYRVVAAVRQIKNKLLNGTLLGPLTFPSGEEIKEIRKMQQKFLRDNPGEVARWIKNYPERVRIIASGN